MDDQQKNGTKSAAQQGKPSQAQSPTEKQLPLQAEKKPVQHDAKKRERECECEALNEKCLRMAAEFDNYKKRTAKEKEAIALQSEARMMLRMLPIYEEIGFPEQGVSEIQDKHVREGALLVLGKLRKSFESEGLLPMKLEGGKYDPFRHEVALREDSGAPEGEIVRVIRPGYLYKGEVLQHAIVSVSSGKKPEAFDGDATGKGKGKEEGKSKQGNSEVGE